MSSEDKTRIGQAAPLGNVNGVRAKEPTAPAADAPRGDEGNLYSYVRPKQPAASPTGSAPATAAIPARSRTLKTTAEKLAAITEESGVHPRPRAALAAPNRQANESTVMA
nr:hypothetical protein [Myxococcota bacterium]